MGRAVFLPCCLTWNQTMVEVMKSMATSFKRSWARTAATQCPRPCSRPLLTHTSAGDSWTLTGKSEAVSSPGCWCTQGFVCALQESVSLVLCTFWQIYGGINGDLLEEGLCQNQVCYTQSPSPCFRPLPTLTFVGDTQTLKGRSGSVSVGSSCVHNVLFEPPEYLWRVWGLIIMWFHPFYHLAEASPLPLDVGYLFFSGIQHSLVDGCSAVSFNFGVLTRRRWVHILLPHCNLR